MALPTTAQPFTVGRGVGVSQGRCEARRLELGFRPVRNPGSKGMNSVDKRSVFSILQLDGFCKGDVNRKMSAKARPVWLEGESVSRE